MYAEMIIGLNMLFNFAILSFAKKIGNVQVKHRRLLFASFIGALPVTVFPTSLVAVIVSFFVMTCAAFGTVFSLWKKSAALVLIGAVFAGGLLTAFQYRMETPSGTVTVLIYAVIAYGALYLMKNKWLAVRTAQHVTALMARSTMSIWGSEIPIKVIVDSGNSCTEPLSGAPVHFITLATLEPFIPIELKDALYSWDANGSPSLKNFPELYLKDIRLIRLHTVQGRSWAVGFKYENWRIEGGGNLEQGYFVVTKENRRYPEGADAILHVSAMETINGERGKDYAA